MGYYVRHYADSVAIVDVTDDEKLSRVLQIPATINGKTVLGIEDNAFIGAEFQMVIVHGDLMYIGKNAFKDSSISTFTCNSVVVVDEGAFSNSQISVFSGFPRRINKGAFDNCENLTVVSGLDKTGVVHPKAFVNTDSLFICAHDTMIYSWCLSTNHKYKLTEGDENIPLVCPKCNSSWKYRKSPDFVEGICPNCKTRITISGRKKVVIASPEFGNDDDIIIM